MKPIVLFTGLLLAGLHTVQAQTNPRSFVEVVGGLSSPLGNFNKIDYRNPASGFAKSGSTGGISGALFFGGHLGLGITLGQASYGVSTFALADGYRQDFAVDEATVSSKHYTVNTLLAGLYYALPFGRFTLDLRGLAGVSAATLPALRVALEDESGFTQQKATATAFAWQVGVGLRARLIKQVGLSLRADYGRTNPDFAVAYAGVNNASGRVISAYNQPIASVSATLGVVYQFGR